MCRYAAITYKPHFACFSCQKTFKRRLMSDIQRGEESKIDAKCPECGQLMANMGKDFESPKKTDHKQWRHLKELYSVGIAFHSCGCTGPGYIPANKADTIAYFNERKADYVKQLNFWRNRIAPTNQNEIDREKSQHSNELFELPGAFKSKQIKNEDAITFWTSKLIEVDQKLAILLSK